MSAVTTWSNLKDRSAGKWQFPLAIVSVVLLGGAFYRLYPPAKHLPLAKGIQYIETLVAAGMYDRALEIGEALSQREEEPDGQRGLLFLLLARARSGEAERLKIHSGAIGKRVAEEFQRATELGEALSADDLLRMGRALEWQERFGEAIDAYPQAVALGAENPFDIRRHLFLLARDHTNPSPADRNEQLDRFLSELDEHRFDLGVWAVEEKLHVLEELGRLEDAATLLTRHADRFRETDFADHFAFLEAWLLYRTGFNQDAEVRLRTVRNHVDRLSEVHAMTGWLLGQVILDDREPQRPLEALSFFSEVIAGHGGTKWSTASHLGMAEALAMLERHDEAVEEYRTAIDGLGALSDPRLINRDVVRVSLGVTADSLKRQRQTLSALEYAELAATLVDRRDAEQSTAVLKQLGQLQASAAESQRASASPLQSQELYAAASETYSEIARINVLNDERAAQSSWRAAELAAESADRGRAIRLFREYVEDWPDDGMVPRALLRLGQLSQSAGDLRGAIQAYQECYQRFPRSLDGGRSLVPLAECYLHLGGDNAELSEKTLGIVLEESELFTPQAPEFADALFLLGDVRVRRGQFEAAIATLNEAIERYVEDPRIPRARYLRGDSFRRSALALKADLPHAHSATEIERIRQDYQARFESARRDFRVLIDTLDRSPSDSSNALEKLYLRHAYLYEADGYFETKEYATALKLYEEGAALLREHPSGLAAHVQIINCLVFLGRPLEARAALSRALVLADLIPEEAFRGSASPEGREDWKRYFRWLNGTELF